MGRHVEYAGCLHQQACLSSFYTGTELNLIRAKSVSDNTKYKTVSTSTFIWIIFLRGNMPARLHQLDWLTVPVVHVCGYFAGDILWTHIVFHSVTM